MRKAADDAFTLAGLSYRVKCEIESLTTLNAALAADLGGTIMPESAARTMLQPANAWMARIVEPNVLTSLSFCMSDHLPLSQPAEAVKGILLSLMAQRTEDNFTANPGGIISPPYCLKAKPSYQPFRSPR